MGAQTKEAVVYQLPDDWSWEGKRALDFGSGAGRTLRHFLIEAQAAEVLGRRHRRGEYRVARDQPVSAASRWQCAEGPPLALEHGTFDLIFAVSVFTHLTSQSLPWLLELHRLLKPDGLLIASDTGSLELGARGRRPLARKTGSG